MAGASFARQNDKRHGRRVSTRARTSGSFTYLGEFDWIDDRTVRVARAAAAISMPPTPRSTSWLFDWLNLRGTFDFVKVSGDRDQTRYAIGAEPFINRFIQPRHPVPDQQRPARPANEPGSSSTTRTSSSSSCTSSSEALGAPRATLTDSTTMPCTPPTLTLSPSTVAFSARLRERRGVGLRIVVILEQEEDLLVAR
mgnify:CR=1 FL=1